MTQQQLLDDAAVVALVQRIEAAPGAFEFSQIVRLLARVYPGRTAVGGFGDPADEAVRFGAHPSLSFPPGDVQRVFPTGGVDDRGEDDGGVSARRPTRIGMRGAGGQPFMEVNFLGLIGPAGVLPKMYTQYTAERVAVRDTALRDFLDLFHHRLISLFYRAWRVCRPHVAAGEGADDDILSERLRSVVGLGIGMHKRDAVHATTAPSRFDDSVLLRHAALLAPHARSASALRQLLSSYLQVPCVVEEFVPAWYRLAPGTQCALGEDDDTTILGLGSVVGDEVLDHGARARVRIGPMSRAMFDGLLPGTRGHENLKSIVRFVAGDAVEVEVRLQLERKAVPATILGTDSGKLGWGTWLRTRVPSRDPDDTSFLF